MSIRKVVTRRGRRFRGYFPSVKLNRMVAYESLLELDAIRLLEFSRGVVWYQEQPALIRYFDGAGMSDYYPDFEIRFVDDTCAHLEVKMSTQLAQPDITAKFAAISARYAVLGQAFRIVTELEIRREPLLKNVRKLLYLTGRRADGLPSRADVVTAVGSRPVPLEIAQERFGADMALRLLANGLLACDLERTLNGDTLVHVIYGGDDATVLI